MKTAIDWTTKPEPWCWIGPQFRRECEGMSSPELPWCVLRRRRLALGLTQVAIGQLAGRPNTAVSGIELGEARDIGGWYAALLDRLEAEHKQAAE